MKQYENIPQELKDMSIWCVWRYERNPKKDKPDKVPYNPVTGGRAQSNNPATFSNFHTALSAVERYDGLGIGVFSDVVFIDIDDCAEDGKVNSFAQGIIDAMDSPAEISPSGKGVRIMCKSLSAIPVIVFSGFST
ncbi:MAG: hypothetical protein FWF10_11605 [Clostridiales bacterium]|nr:hypothetical protein [Clostridiales bacterium]